MVLAEIRKDAGRTRAEIRTANAGKNRNRIVFNELIAPREFFVGAPNHSMFCLMPDGESG